MSGPKTQFLMGGQVVTVTNLGERLVQLKVKHDNSKSVSEKRLLMKKMRGIAQQMVNH